MRAVEVRYTVRPEYADQNKANIRKVMAKLRASPIDGMMYSAYTLEDGHSFVHINICQDEETLSKLNDVDEFVEFRKALKESLPITPPSSIDLEYVGANFDI